MSTKEKLLSNAVLGLALILSAFTLARSIYSFSDSKRLVSVKGFAEREVKADLVVWPMKLSSGGMDLSSVRTNLQKSMDAVTQFWISKGFNRSEISISVPEIRDNDLFSYGGAQARFRYIVTLGMTLRTSKVDEALVAMTDSYDLLSKGVVFSEEYLAKPTFLFTKLDQIKPEMIAQATVNAKEAAMQFAKNSGGSVGAIQQATQGLFSIEDRDIASPQFKNVRVVTNLSYYLE